jgi:hypothetical protein
MRTAQDRLVRALTGKGLPAPEPVRTSVGTVTDVDATTNTVTLDIGGVSVPGVPAQAGSFPEVGQSMLVMTTGASPIAMPPTGPLTSAPPGQVQNLVVTQMFGGFAVHWDAVTDQDVIANRGDYQIQVDSDDTFEVPFVDKRLASTLVVITGDDLALEPSNTYYARVRAVDRANEPGPWSETASGKPGQIRLGWIAADVITANEIAAAAITAALIEADAFSGATITGATIQTGATGERIAIEPNAAGHPAIEFWQGIHEETAIGALHAETHQYRTAEGDFLTAQAEWATSALNFQDRVRLLMESAASDGVSSFARASLHLGEDTTFGFTKDGLDAPGFFTNGAPVMPTGAIVLWGGPGEPPPGWLWADGTDASRVSWPRLFEVYGEAYGAGDGFSTFGTVGVSNYADLPFIVKAV